MGYQLPAGHAGAGWVRRRGLCFWVGIKRVRPCRPYVPRMIVVDNALFPAVVVKNFGEGLPIPLIWNKPLKGIRFSPAPGESVIYSSKRPIAY